MPIEAPKGSEHATSKDPVQVYALGLADSDLLHLISRRAKLARFFRMGSVPVIIIESQNNSIARLTSEIGDMATIAGLSEEEMRKRAIMLTDGVLDKFSRGQYNTGEYLSGVQKSDKPVIEEFKKEIENGQVTFVAQNSQERLGSLREQIRQEIQRKKEMAKRVNQFAVGGKWYNFGEEIDVGQFVEAIDPEENDPVILSVPIISGINIQIQASQWKDKYFPIREQNQFGLQDDISFLQYNALLHYQGNPNPTNSKKRLIVPITREKIESIMHVKPVNNKNLLEEITEPEFEGRFFNQQTPALMRSILKQKIGLDKDTTMHEIPSATAVQLVSNFLRKNSSGSDVATGGDMKLEDLLSEYQAEGLFPGTCKSMSVLAAGFCEVLGLRVRAVYGTVLDSETGESYGHQWAEIYLPEIKSWALIDASLGNNLIYPNHGDIYFMESNIHLPKEKPLKIKVEVI